jgi:hypothetical protein
MLSSISHSLVPPPRGAGRAPVCLLIFVAKSSRDRHCCVWRYQTIENGIRREVYSGGRSSSETIKKVTMALLVSGPRHSCTKPTRSTTVVRCLLHEVLCINSLKGLSCQSVSPSVRPSVKLQFSYLKLINGFR